jgi:hypothetical protein
VNEIDFDLAGHIDEAKLIDGHEDSLTTHGTREQTAQQDSDDKIAIVTPMNLRPLTRLRESMPARPVATDTPSTKTNCSCYVRPPQSVASRSCAALELIQLMEDVFMNLQRV